MFVVSAREEGFFLKKTALVWSRYRDANTVPTSPFADDLATVPSGPV